jgi:hypothetical protein
MLLLHAHLAESRFQKKPRLAGDAGLDPCPLVGQVKPIHG